MKLFAFRGIRVLVDPILIVLLAVAALLGVGRDMVLMFAFVFGHELCHTLMAIALGVEIDEIELLPFGGVARARGMDRVVGWREVLIALVGPLFNFLCAWCCLMAAKLWPQFAPALLTPVYLNLTMGCFNPVSYTHLAWTPRRRLPSAPGKTAWWPYPALPYPVKR